MDKEELLSINPLFLGLTRAPMMMGVTMDYLGLSLIGVMCGFILFSSPFCLLMYFPLHIFGVVVCAVDHNFFRLLLKNLECLTIPNYAVWGCQCYEPF